MSQLILDRQNTMAVRQQVLKATDRVHNKLDASTLMRHDVKTTWRSAIGGVWDLVAQRRVFALMSLNLAATSLSLSGAWRIEGQFGYVDILGWTVGLLVTFRQNQAMLRFWEARTAWGKLVTLSRDIVRAVVMYNNDKDSSMEFAMYVIALAITCKNHLREEPESCDREELEPLLSPEDLAYLMSQNGMDRPVAVIDMMSGTIVQALNNDTISNENVQHVLEPKIMQLNDCLGSTVRIKTTPIPPMYRVVLDMVLLVFLLLLPFSLLAQSWHGVSVFVVCTVVNVVLNGLAKLGGQLEDPFGKDLNDLPLGTYTADVMKQVLHVTDRWYKPNSILLQSKEEQRRQHVLHNKIRRAQVKSMVISTLRTSKSSVPAMDSFLDPLKAPLLSSLPEMDSGDETEVEDEPAPLPPVTRRRRRGSAFGRMQSLSPVLEQASDLSPQGEEETRGEDERRVESEHLRRPRVDDDWDSSY